ncbi:tetratricopeptide repeat protein [Pseudonocardia cypriaca]|uniref:Tetratricopeptide repeat protein n=1 Tax=Pseudonocardia cypriaca TaxID=882449 RepID=A0A543FT13_9PSEU|nr:tetratricopeptide repeat protein [Pseudonocardia cypriaca]
MAYLDQIIEQSGPGPVVVTIDGMAGIGKTALAAHVAHRWSSRYPDGQLFLDLQGYTRGVRPVDPRDALGRLLRAIGVPGGQIPDDLEDRAALYRSCLADRTVLVLLDNAASEAQVLPQLPGSGGSLVMITSRRRLAGLDVTHAHSLGILAADDAVDLLVRSSGRSGSPADQRDQLMETAELCGFLPLAVRIAAARLRSRPSWSLLHLNERLRCFRHRLAELEAGDRGVTAALDLSYAHLEPDLRYGYRMLALHPGLDFDVDAAATLMGQRSTKVEPLLDHLLEVHLLQEHVPGRYRFHDLIRAHAMEVARVEEGQADRRDALVRLAEHYCRAVRSAVDLLYPYERENRRRAGDADENLLAVEDPARAATWVETELTNLLAVAESSDLNGWPEGTLRLSALLHRHLRTRGRYSDGADLHERAVCTARKIGDRLAELDALNDLGHMRRLQGRFPDAIALFAEVRCAARTTGDQHGDLNALIGIGQVHLMQGRYTEAVGSFGAARSTAVRIGCRGRELEALLGLGWVRVAQGDPAVAELQRAVELARAVGHSTAEVRALTALGLSHRLGGRHGEAMSLFEQAMRVARAAGEQPGELEALIRIASLQRILGRFEEAGVMYERAVRVAREVGSRNYEFEALHGSGRLQNDAGRPREALALHQRALDLAVSLGQAAEEARAHDGLAHAHSTLEDHEQARAHWRRALSILIALGSARTEEPETTTAAIRSHLERLDAEAEREQATSASHAREVLHSG